MNLKAELSQSLREIERLKRQLAEQNEQIARLNELLQKDTMTGLLNRAGLIEHLNTLISQQTRIGGATFVTFIDVDDFKRLNTDFGHDGGDFALVSLAKRLKQAVRQHDVVARWSGDEFVVAFHLTEKELAAGVQNIIPQRLSKLVKTPVVFHGRDMQVTCSFGVVRYDQPAQVDCNDLITAADEAMYVAKNGGKDAVEMVPFRKTA